MKRGIQKGCGPPGVAPLPWPTLLTQKLSCLCGSQILQNFTNCAPSFGLPPSSIYPNSMQCSLPGPRGIFLQCTVDRAAPPKHTLPRKKSKLENRFYTKMGIESVLGRKLFQRIDVAFEGNNY